MSSWRREACKSKCKSTSIQGWAEALPKAPLEAARKSKRQHSNPFKSHETTQCHGSAEGVRVKVLLFMWRWIRSSPRDNCSRGNKLLCPPKRWGQDTTTLLYGTETIVNRELKLAHFLPSILIIAFRDCDCFDSPCIDPCWTPLRAEIKWELRFLLHNPWSQT